MSDTGCRATEQGGTDRAGTDLDADALGTVQGGLRAGRGRRSQTGGVAGDERPATILLVGLDVSTTGALRRQLSGIELIEVADVDAARAALDSRSVAAVCCGATLEPAAARRLLDDERVAGAEAIVLAAGGDLALFQDLVDAERLYYLTPRPPPPPIVAALLESALEHRRADRRSEGELLEHSALELLGQLATERRLPSVVSSVLGEMQRLLEAETVDCRIHDAADETLWRPRDETDVDADDAVRDSTASGLVGFVARTGRAIRLDRVGDDPRYDADADTDGESPEDRFLAVPIVTDAVLAVLIARRGPRQPPFADASQAVLDALGRQLAPIFARFELERRLERAAPAVFRSAARTHHAAGNVERGRPLQLVPQWTGWALALLVAMVVAFLGFALFGSIHQYAQGPAVIRLGDRLDVTTRLSGIVTSVDVEPGAEVAAGDLIARLDAAHESAELASLEAEYEAALAQRLRDPFDAASGAAVASLRSRLDLAATRLEERSVRAPRAGVVGDVRSRPGSHLLPGEVVASLVDPRGAPRVVAFLPGSVRPFLEPGMRLRLELDGSTDSDQWLEIDAVADEVVGPAEARRVLGAGLVDAVPLSGPVVRVVARLPSTRFESEGETYRVHEGVSGFVEVRLRSESLLSTVLPGLDRLLDRRSTAW
ncbi:MAG: HlyD family efflux transporter periplasmic adaptor subunit [Acidobacteriota bacterium]